MAAANLTLWDTQSLLPQSFDAQDRSGWKAVPSDLFALETDPAKASSDPGYYGREYVSHGDAVIENRSLMAAFQTAQGRVLLFTKSANSGGTNAPVAQQIAALIPTTSAGESADVRITRLELVRNFADEIAVRAYFSSSGQALFTVGRSGVLEVRPEKDTKQFRLLSPVQYGIVPSFIGDDLIFGAAEEGASSSLCVPAESFFVGLVRGEESMLVMTWPKGNQQLSLLSGNDTSTPQVFKSIEFQDDGQSFFLAPLTAPGIWHREELGPSFLETDVASQWKPPFAARWKTQLTEAGVRTSFAFRPGKGNVWRGVPGSYTYPVWFDGQTAYYHLSKKVPPEGESLVYFLEPSDTPPGVLTPVDILNSTLGRPMADLIVDDAGRKLRTHHRRGGEGVRRACTCGCTEAIQAVFEAGQEVEKKNYINGALEDMVYFVQHHVERIAEYRRFAEATLDYLHIQESSTPDLKPYLEELAQIAEEIPHECEVQKQNMKSLDYAAQLTRQTLALTSKNDTQNLAAYMELLKDWRGMGGAQDYVVAQCHAITRKLFQQAGYQAATQRNALAVAEQVRARCREILRNPDGYEIWPNY